MLGLPPRLARNLTDLGITDPTPIQTKAIPEAMNGRDVMGLAQTGTGKTAAFALPLLHRLAESAGPARRGQPHALILAPTRELANQINDSFRTYGRHLRLRTAVVYGGTPIRAQIRALSHGVHVLVATPGRLLDLMNQRHVRLDGVETDSVPEQFREIIRWSGEELTPDASLGPVFEHVRAHVVVCGHTHMQFDRWVGDAGAIRAGRTAVVSGSAKPRFSA